MTDREKLIDLLSHEQLCPDDVEKCSGECPYFDKTKFNYCKEEEATADMLIANGVVFPVLCKDCVQYAPYEKPVEGFDGRCLVRECETDEEEFCSYGIRKVD